MNNNSDGMRLFVIGASLAGLAAAYYFLSPKGKRHLENTKSWVIKMKGDVVEKLEQAREISEDVYNRIIDSVATKYEKNLKSNPEEIRAVAQDLKAHWDAISRSAKNNNKKIGSSKEVSKPKKVSKSAKAAS